MKLQPGTYLLDLSAVTREGGREASVKARVARAIEHRKDGIQVAEAFPMVEGNMDIPAMVRGYQACGVEDPMDACTYPVGTWEVSTLPCGRAGTQREGALRHSRRCTRWRIQMRSYER